MPVLNRARAAGVVPVLPCLPNRVVPVPAGVVPVPAALGFVARLARGS